MGLGIEINPYFGGGRGGLVPISWSRLRLVDMIAHGHRPVAKGHHPVTQWNPTKNLDEPGHTVCLLDFASLACMSIVHISVPEEAFNDLMSFPNKPMLLTLMDRWRSPVPPQPQQPCLCWRRGVPPGAPQRQRQQSGLQALEERREANAQTPVARAGISSSFFMIVFGIPTHIT